MRSQAAAVQERLIPAAELICRFPDQDSRGSLDTTAIVCGGEAEPLATVKVRLAGAMENVGALLQRYSVTGIWTGPADALEFTVMAP